MTTPMPAPPQPFDRPLENVLNLLRDATRGTDYEGKLYLVGGLLRDRFLGQTHGCDLDLVLEGDAVALAHFLHARGVSHHFPVTYPRFGTAMLHVGGDEASEGSAVELVSARAESYQPDSRKPEVRQSTLREDVLRRDFTLNTLLENLHTGEVLDLTGRAWDDLRAGILRTPLQPRVTFFDDPLRMLRAVRFAARFAFTIEASAWAAIEAEAERLRPPAIANERIREEFIKIARLSGARFRRGMELLLESGLLAQFLPEMLPMVGCTQGSWHRYDVWEHTLNALEFLPDASRLELRLALLWHDIGKPETRSQGKRKGDPALTAHPSPRSDSLAECPPAGMAAPNGIENSKIETQHRESREESGVSVREKEGEKAIHFYGHPTRGAEIVRLLMQRLKFSNEEIRDTAALVEKHMRLGQYRPDWGDAPVKRLIRDCGPLLDDLFTLARADAAGASIPAGEAVDLAALRARIEALDAGRIAALVSPLDGIQIMATLGIGPGPHLRDAKEFLVNEMIEGRLPEGDPEEAQRLLRTWWASVSEP